MPQDLLGEDLMASRNDLERASIGASGDDVPCDPAEEPAYALLGIACEGNGLAGFGRDGEMWFQPPGDLIAEQTAEPLLRAMREACDLLAERTYGSAARSPGHNARLTLEAAIQLDAGAHSPSAASAGKETRDEPLLAPVLDREEIARIIDPDPHVWRSASEWDKSPRPYFTIPRSLMRTPEEVAASFEDRREAALAKADAILALLPPVKGGGGSSSGNHIEAVRAGADAPRATPEEEMDWDHGHDPDAPCAKGFR